MNKDKTNKKSNSDTTKKYEWFIENGYARTVETIDINGDLDVPEAFMQLFVAYNQHNIAEGKAWDTWPDWELVLTSMKTELHFEDSESDTPEIIAERQHWLSLVQLMYDSEAVTIDGYTISIEGLHGHQFTFDMCLENEMWVSPRSLAKHYEKIKEDGNKLSSSSSRINQASYYTRFAVEHSLEEYWKCPEHVPKYGGKSTIYTHDNIVCIDKEEGNTFPLGMHALIKLCIDDTKIWKILFEQDLENIEYHEFMEREFPNGIPEQECVDLGISNGRWKEWKK